MSVNEPKCLKSKQVIPLEKLNVLISDSDDRIDKSDIEILFNIKRTYLFKSNSWNFFCEITQLILYISNIFSSMYLCCINWKFSALTTEFIDLSVIHWNCNKTFYGPIIINFGNFYSDLTLLLTESFCTNLSSLFLK